MYTPSFPHGIAPTLTMCTVEGVNTYRCHHYPWNNFAKQKTLYKEQKFCDIVLIAGIDGTKVPAHKLVLSAASAYFLAMFGGSMIESEAKEVTIQQISGKTLKTLVDFIYSGYIDVSNETLQSVLHAADFFLLNDVIDSCCEYMIRNLSVSNCLGRAMLAEKHSCRTVYMKSLELAFSNFEKLCSESEFLELGEDVLSILLSCDELSVSSEEHVFLSLVLWVEYKKEREQLLPRLLPHIRFNFLELSFIMANKDSVCKTPECEQLVSEWIKWHKLTTEKPTETRRSNDKLALVSSLNLQTYSRPFDEWFSIDIPTSKNRQGTWVFANQMLILVGGGMAIDATKAVDGLNPKTMNWTSLPPLRVARGLCSVVELDGQLYALGGGVSSMWRLYNCESSAEKFDFHTNKWQIIASLPKRLGSKFHAAAAHGLLYAISAQTCALECYDPHTNKWSPRSDKPEKVTQFGMTAVGRFLYTLGGYCNQQRSKTVERYDTSTDTWTVVSKLDIGRTDIRCLAFRNRLIAIGGHDGKENVNIVQEYNPYTGEWKTLAQVPFFRNYICIPVVLKDGAQLSPNS